MNNNPTGKNQYSKGTAAGRANRSQAAKGFKLGASVRKGAKVPFSTGTSYHFQKGFHAAVNRAKVR